MPCSRNSPRNGRGLKPAQDWQYQPFRNMNDMYTRCRIARHGISRRAVRPSCAAPATRPDIMRRFGLTESAAQWTNARCPRHNYISMFALYLPIDKTSRKRTSRDSSESRLSEGPIRAQKGFNDPDRAQRLSRLREGVPFLNIRRRRLLSESAAAFGIRLRISVETQRAPIRIWREMSQH